MAEPKETVSKETLIGLITGPKQLNVCLMQMREDHLCITMRTDESIVIPYDTIRDISCTQDNDILISFHAPQMIIQRESDAIWIMLHGVCTDEVGSYCFSSDPKWTNEWEKYLKKTVFEYQNHRRSSGISDKEPLFIDQAECLRVGLMPFEIVNSSQEVLFSAGSHKKNLVTIYSTDTRLLIRRSSHDFISIPYSVIMDISVLIAETIYLFFCYPQNLSCLSEPISVVSFSRIPDSHEDYSAFRSSLWQQNWVVRIRELTQRVAMRKGILHTGDLISIIDEVRHSPTKYELSVYAQHGWDLVCQATLRKISSWQTYLYLFVIYLSREYESMKMRTELETEPKRQEAYLGSQMAYASILTCIAHKTSNR